MGAAGSSSRAAVGHGCAWSRLPLRLSMRLLVHKAGPPFASPPAGCGTCGRARSWCPRMAWAATSTASASAQRDTPCCRGHGTTAYGERSLCGRMNVGTAVPLWRRGGWEGARHPHVLCFASSKLQAQAAPASSPCPAVGRPPLLTRATNLQGVGHRNGHCEVHHQEQRACALLRGCHPSGHLVCDRVGRQVH